MFFSVMSKQSAPALGWRARSILPLAGPLRQMTSQGSAHGRFTRALAQRNLRGAEIAAKEMGGLSLLVLVDYLELLGGHTAAPGSRFVVCSVGTFRAGLARAVAGRFTGAVKTRNVWAAETAMREMGTPSPGRRARPP